jgi:hypothetical protein
MKDRHTGVSAWRLAACLWLVIVALLPTTSRGQSDSGRMSTTETVKATQALIRWLECDSCGDANLKAVTRYGQAVVPSLIATLNAGLSPASRKSLHDAFASRYDALDEQARKDPKFKMKSTKEEFIARYVEETDARNRIRAAEALGTIGGSTARTALKTALIKSERADVRKAIQNALQEIR